MSEEIKTSFTIEVTTEKKLSKEEIREIGTNFVSRLHGYTTECPEVLVGVKMVLQFPPN